MELNKQDLYNLLQSLTADYYKMVINHFESNLPAALPLLEVLSSTSFYDEEVVNSKLIAIKFEDKDKYTQQAIQLIFEVVNSNRIEPQDIVRFYIKTFRVLVDKRQFNICSSILEKIKHLIDKYSLQDYKNDYHYFEKVLINYGYLNKPFYESEREHIQHCQEMANLWEYRELNLQVMEHGGRIIVRGDRGKRMNYFLQHELLQDENKALSFDAKLLFNAICGSIYRSRFNYEKSAKHYLRMIELYQSRPYFISLRWNPYLAIVNNYANIVLILKNYSEAMKMVDLLKEMSEEKKGVEENDLSIDLLIRAFFIEVQIYKETLQLDAANELIPKVENYLDNHENSVKIMYRTGLWYEMAVIRMYQERYKDSLYYIELIFNYSKAILNFTDVRIMSHLLQLVILVELDKYKQLDKYINQVKTFIKDKKIKSRYEILMIDLFERIVQENPQKGTDLYPIYKEYLQLFSTITSFIDEDNYFDVISWLEAKLSQKKIIEVLATK